MAIGTIAKTGATAVKESLGIISKQLSNISSKLAPAAKTSSSLISKYPLASAGLAAVGGAGAITGLYAGAEAISPYIPGDFNFAFGSKTPGGNVWKPYNPQTGKFENEKKDYLKYVAIGGIVIVGIFGVGYLLRQANTTVGVFKPAR